MIICMSDFICITNRKLCHEPFLERVKSVAESKPKAIVLREKDLDESEYILLAADVLKIGEKYGVPIILHTFAGAAIRLGCDKIHMPLPALRNMSDDDKKHFTVIGCSCHSVDEAVEAAHLGATYITAGHIFQTDCKKGVPPRGLDFLHDVCSAVSVPVYAIGGIKFSDIDVLKSCGVAGGCIMSGFMAQK